MPADYTSTARALALPIDDSDEDPSQRHGISPAWTRRSSSSLHHAYSPASSTIQTLKARFLDTASQVQRQAVQTYLKLSPLQRILVVLAGIVSFVLGILFLVYNHAIFKWLAPAAQKWRGIRGGWLILWFMTFVVSFPPLIGYSTCVTLAGFVYGFPKGWFIVSTATILGSTASFFVSRHFLLRQVTRLVSSDSRFSALSLVLKHDGPLLLIMIRLCPLPYSLSNGALATIPTVSPWAFMLATAVASPKLLIHVFVGSRLAELAEGGEKMDAKTKAVNYISILIGVTAGIATGWFIYRKTSARARQLEAEERELEREEEERRSREYTDDTENGGVVAGLRRYRVGKREDDSRPHGNHHADGHLEAFSDEEGSGDVFGHGYGDEEQGFRDSGG